MLFNTQQHRTVFCIALLELIKELCPTNIADEHYKEARQLLQIKCIMMRYRLDLLLGAPSALL